MAKVTHITYKVPGYTLFETIIAITIITVLIGLSTMIYSNCVDQENPLLYYQAEEDVKQHFEALKSSGNYINQSFDHEQYTIDQKVDFHKGNKELLAITYVVMAGTENWMTKQHLVVNKEHE